MDPIVGICVSVVIVLMGLLYSQQNKIKQLEAKVAAVPINKSIRKKEGKVVDFCEFADIEDIDKKVFCRCWKSKTFPLCDGSHNAHNECCKDNVGPLIVKGGKKA